jgi:hypothetical protein
MGRPPSELCEEQHQAGEANTEAQGLPGLDPPWLYILHTVDRRQPKAEIHQCSQTPHRPQTDESGADERVRYSD